jgi:hypothetical protein
MICRTAWRAALLAAVVLSACQSQQVQPVRTPMDGRWASTDGVFIAEFQGGSFTSRFTQTNEILAQGTYAVNGGTVSLRWLSVQAQAQRSATCTFTSASLVHCQQDGGGAFELQRSA